MGKINGIIYTATNTVNGKMYIGQTKSSLNVRINQHKSDMLKLRDNTAFHKAIRKHFFEAFT